MTTADLVGTVVGVALTLLILSYMIGDNPLYRLALYLLTGAAVGYGVALAVVALFQQVILPLLQGGTAERYGLLVPIVLGLLLLFKGFPRWAPWGNLSTALLIGVGAAVAVAGALLGTVLPQSVASGSLADWLRGGAAGLINGLLIAVGTICALLAFAFTVPRQRALQRLWRGTAGAAGVIGRLFLASAFGAAFAAALTASLSILIGRIYTLIEGVQRLLQMRGG